MKHDGEVLDEKSNRSHAHTAIAKQKNSSQKSGNIVTWPVK